jgi:hypothetical protein
MKNSLIILVFLVLVCGCKQPSNNASVVGDSGSSTGTLVFYDARLREYDAFTAKLDSTKPESSTLAINKFTSLFKNSEKELCDSAYYIFEVFYSKLGSTITNQYMTEGSTEKYEYFLMEPKPTNVVKPSAQDVAFYQSLLANGFKLQMTDGFIYIDQDRDFVTKHFSNYVSVAMNTYQTQFAKENKEIYSDDGGLLITPTQLSERLAWWDGFIVTNPKFIFNNEAKMLKVAYLTSLLRGLDNTPIIDQTTLKINEDYEAAFKSLKVNHPNTDATNLAMSYYQLLSKKDTAQSNALLANYLAKGYISY